MFSIEQHSQGRTVPSKQSFWICPFISRPAPKSNGFLLADLTELIIFTKFTKISTDNTRLKYSESNTKTGNMSKIHKYNTRSIKVIKEWKQIEF